MFILYFANSVVLNNNVFRFMLLLEINYYTTVLLFQWRIGCTVMTSSHRKRAERFCRAHTSEVLDGTTPSLSLQAAMAICGEFQLKQRKTNLRLTESETIKVLEFKNVLHFEHGLGNAK